MSNENDRPIDPDRNKRLLLYVGLPIILTLCGYLGIVLEDVYGDVAWYKAIAHADYGDGPYERDESSALGTNSVVSAGQAGGATTISTPDKLYEDQIFGYNVTCVDINTPDWGYPEHYDPSRPEVSTAGEAIHILEQEVIGYLGSEVILRQGDRVRILATDSPELNSLANRSSLCVSR